MTDDQRTTLVETLLDSLAALRGSTLPADDLRAIAADLEDHANDLDNDELEEPADGWDHEVAEADLACDVERDHADEERIGQ